MHQDSVQIGQHTELRHTRNGLMLFNRLDWPISVMLKKYGETGCGEMALFQHLLKPDWTVIEAGAHIGTLTVCLAKHAKRVFAFEPQRANFNYLCANMALNECDNVKAQRFAIGDADGKIMCPILDPNAPNNTGGVILPEATDGEVVAMRSLDSLDIPFDFLKADVENMEIDVLRGGAKIIKECQPVLYLEVNLDPAPILTLLDSMGYEAWWHTPPLVEHPNFYECEDNMYPGIVSLNILCAPVGKMKMALPKAVIGKQWTECV